MVSLTSFKPPFILHLPSQTPDDVTHDIAEAGNTVSKAKSNKTACVIAYI